MGYKDKDREREYKREWGQKNAERLKAKRHIYYLANKEKFATKAIEWAKNNPEKRSAARRLWKQNNKDKVVQYQRLYERSEAYKEYQRKYYSVHKTRRAEHYRSWDVKNRPHRNAYAADRKARKKTSTPVWVCMKEIRIIYQHARSVGLTVDHIVPLKHPLVCGLHVPWNLQLLSHEENSRKTNKFQV